MGFIQETHKLAYFLIKKNKVFIHTKLTILYSDISIHDDPTRWNEGGKGQTIKKVYILIRHKKGLTNVQFRIFMWLNIW